MKVLNICVDDWANYSFINAKALRSIGVNATSIKLNPHQFWYKEQCRIVTFREMEEEIKRHDIINYMHGNVNLFKETKHLLKGKKVIVSYTGSAYRNDPVHHNGLFNPIVDMSFTDQCEFFGLGAKNLFYTPVAVDSNEYKSFGRELRRPYIVGHYPSNAEVKGSQKIISMVDEIQKNSSLFFNFSDKKVSHEEQLNRMQKCDIYIELFKPELYGKPYGCYGVTAFEAAAMGKVVVTQNIRKDVYIKTFGSCPLVICNTEQDFIQSVTGLVNLDEMRLSEIQTETYNWLNLKHGLQATGRYISKLYGL